MVDRRKRQLVLTPYKHTNITLYTRETRFEKKRRLLSFFRRLNYTYFNASQ